MIIYLNSSPNGSLPPPPPTPENIIFENGVWTLDTYDLVPSVAAPSGFTISDNMIISESTSSGRSSGFILLPKDTTTVSKIKILLKGTSNSSSGPYQFGRCDVDADAYVCAASGTGRQTFQEGSLGYEMFREGSETINPNSAFFVAFGKDLGIIKISAS